jgi:hypothetical protein
VAIQKAQRTFIRVDIEEPAALTEFKLFWNERQSKQAHVRRLRDQAAIGEVIDLEKTRCISYEQIDFGSFLIVAQHRSFVFKLKVAAQTFDAIRQFVAGIIIELPRDQMVGRKEEAGKQRREDHRVQEGDSRTKSGSFHDS